MSISEEKNEYFYTKEKSLEISFAEGEKNGYESFYYEYGVHAICFFEIRSNLRSLYSEILENNKESSHIIEQKTFGHFFNDFIQIVKVKNIIDPNTLKNFQKKVATTIEYRNKLVHNFFEEDGGKTELKTAVSKIFSVCADVKKIYNSIVKSLLLENKYQDCIKVISQTDIPLIGRQLLYYQHIEYLLKDINKCIAIYNNKEIGKKGGLSKNSNQIESYLAIDIVDLIEKCELEVDKDFGQKDVINIIKTNLLERFTHIKKDIESIVKKRQECISQLVNGQFFEFEYSDALQKEILSIIKVFETGIKNNMRELIVVQKTKIQYAEMEYYTFLGENINNTEHVTKRFLELQSLINIFNDLDEQFCKTYTNYDIRMNHNQFMCFFEKIDIAIDNLRSCYFDIFINTQGKKELMARKRTIEKFYDGHKNVLNTFDTDVIKSYFNFIEALLGKSENKPRTLVEINSLIGKNNAFELQINTIIKNHEKTAYENAIQVMTPKTPKRNDACPCGSGKKYKKCCGK